MLFCLSTQACNISTLFNLRASNIFAIWNRNTKIFIGEMFLRYNLSIVDLNETRFPEIGAGCAFISMNAAARFILPDINDVLNPLLKKQWGVLKMYQWVVLHSKYECNNFRILRANIYKIRLY